MILLDIIKKFEHEIPSFRSTIMGNVDVDIDGMNLCNRESEHSNIISYATTDRICRCGKESNAYAALIVNENDANSFIDT